MTRTSNQDLWFPPHKKDSLRWCSLLDGRQELLAPPLSSSCLTFLCVSSDPAHGLSPSARRAHGCPSGHFFLPHRRPTPEFCLFMTRLKSPAPPPLPWADVPFLERTFPFPLSHPANKIWPPRLQLALFPGENGGNTQEVGPQVAKVARESNPTTSSPRLLAGASQLVLYHHHLVISLLVVPTGRYPDRWGARRSEGLPLEDPQPMTSGSAPPRGYPWRTLGR